MFLVVLVTFFFMFISSFFMLLRIKCKYYLLKIHKEHLISSDNALINAVQVFCFIINWLLTFLFLLSFQITSDLKLTVLYLMDSIVKNHSDPYKRLFSRNLVSIFSHVFKHSNEKSRAALFKLRGTWNDVFWPSILLELDKTVNKQDPAWPVAKPKASKVSQPTNIHINPAVFGRQSSVSHFSLFVSKLLGSFDWNKVFIKFGTWNVRRWKWEIWSERNNHTFHRRRVLSWSGKFEVINNRTFWEFCYTDLYRGNLAELGT